MIIRSQDKKKIVNFDVCHLSITADNCIVATNGVISYPSEMLSGVIGEYSTEEKAIKVLDMIQNVYIQYGTIKDGLGSIHGAFNIPKCFQMPSDEEVEV